MVSIIIPAFKMGRFIAQALDSVGAQIHSEWEVIVVDDCGPEDGTRQAFEAFAKRHPGNRVEFIRHEINGGVSKARNTAISAAQGEFLAFLDPDDWWEPEYLERQLQVFREHPGTGVAFAGTRMVDVEGKKLREWSPPDDYLADWPGNLYRRNFINPSMTVARTEAVLEVGGFDVAPKIQHVEDWDLWIRLASVGMKFRRSDAPLVNYRQHGSAASADGEKFRQREEAIHRKFLSDPRMADVVLARLREAERQRDRVEAEYRNLVGLNQRSLQSRLKSWIRK